MARYFGGFRDRLKKRSKHIPITIKDVEWVKVATTFSWSPAKRDYHWLEPEDYLSSFLNSSESPYNDQDSNNGEIHGDGSIDASMEMPFSGGDYDGSETLIGKADSEEPEDEENKIAYVPPYDFVPEPALSDSEEAILRPNINVPAELPLLDEYKLEIVSALQRRGIKIDTSKILLPEELSARLNGYHEGRVSIDSYELRARLQKYKRQVIESFEQFNAVSGPIHTATNGKGLDHDAPLDNPEPEEENYESFILSSLNRLEASMNKDELTIDAVDDMITPELKSKENHDFFDEKNQTSDVRGSIRTTRHIELPPDTSDILAEGLTGADSNDNTSDNELPSSYADDSWLVLPVDSRKAGQDLEHPDDLDDIGDSTLVNEALVNEDPVNEDPANEDPANEDPANEDPANAAILDSVFDVDIEEEGVLDGNRADSSELLKALNTINSRFPESSIDAEELDLTTDNLEEDLQYDPIVTDSGSTEVVSDHDEVNLINNLPEMSELEAPSQEALTEPADDTSLSELLLQLRHEGDKISQEDTAEVKASTEDVIDASTDIEQEANVVSDEFVEPVASDTLTETVEQKRARYIEEERKKLYLLIDDLEESTTLVETTSVAEKEGQPPEKEEKSGSLSHPLDEDDNSRNEAHKVVLVEPQTPEKTVVEKAVVEKAVVEKAVVEKAVVEKAVVEKAVVEKAVVEKAVVKKAVVEDPEPENDEEKKSALIEHIIAAKENIAGHNIAGHNITEHKNVSKPDEILKAGALETEPVEEELTQTSSFGSIGNIESPPVQPPTTKKTVPEASLDREESLQNEPIVSSNASEPVLSPIETKTPGPQEKQEISEPSVSLGVAAEQKKFKVNTVIGEQQAEQTKRIAKDKTFMSEPQTTEEKTSPASESNQSEPSEMIASPVPEKEVYSSVGSSDEVPLVLETVEEKVDEGLLEADEPVTPDASLAHVVESLAFATEDPIPLKKIARIYSEILGVRLPTEKKVREALAKLNDEYSANGRSYRIKEWAGGVRMASHPQYARFIRALYKDHRPKKLSRTLMETLAIIAYSQPSTKPEIDFVRGVDSDYAVRKLLELGLIDIVGRSDSIGRPLLYGTSERFLEQFGLSEIEALPKLREVEELLGDPAFKKERLQLLALEEMDAANNAMDEKGVDEKGVDEKGVDGKEDEEVSTSRADDEVKPKSANGDETAEG